MLLVGDVGDVGDVGGTKTILVLFKPSGGGWDCAKRTLYASADYKTFTELLVSFLLDADTVISLVCIGVARSRFCRTKPKCIAITSG
jgi:glucokinase